MSNYETSASITLEVNGKNAEDRLKALRQRAEDLENALARARNTGDKIEMNKLQKELKKTNKEIREMSSSAQQAESVMRRLDRATPRELSKTLSTLRKQLDNIERGSAAWNAQIEKIKAVQRELNSVKGSMKEHESLWSRFAKKMYDWGSALTMSMAAISGLTITGRRAVQSYADMEGEMANVRKFTGMTTEEVERLNESFKTMDTRSSREQLNKLAQEAGKLGIASQQAVIEYVEAADVINVALDELGEGATRDIGKLSSIYGDAERMGLGKAMLAVGAAINEVSQNSTASASYLVDFENRMAGVGKQADMSIPKIMGYASVLDQNAQQVEMSATALQGIIMKMYQDPGKLARIAGINVKEFARLVREDANEALLQLLDTLGKAGGMQALAPMFDEIYINELDLGDYEYVNMSNTPPEWLWRSIDRMKNYISLPWVNNYSGNIQNEVVYENGTYKWHPDTKGVSFQPYLLFIAKQICEVLGYSYDFGEWERSTYRHLIVCNSLPYAWDMPQIAKALPHWTVTEFFEHLENFLSAFIDVDHRGKTVTFHFIANDSDFNTSITLNHVVDDFTVEVSSEGESSYRGVSTLRYSDCDHEMWKFYSCNWLVENHEKMIVRYETLNDLIEANKNLKETVVGVEYPDSNLGKILYVESLNTYFVFRPVKIIPQSCYDPVADTYYDQYVNILQPINQFGERIGTNEESDSIEIGIVPAWIDDTKTSKGQCLFLELDFNDGETDGNSEYLPISLLESGESEKSGAYFSQLFVAFWDGTNYFKGLQPRPIIDKISTNEDWTYVETGYSMRLNRDPSDLSYFNSPIDSCKKYNFQFLANKIPPVRALFFIQGKPYICEKITATFTEYGMSQLLKGTFYRTD